MLALAGCATQTQALLQAVPADLPPRVELERTPFFDLPDYQCGPASLAMVLGAAGLPVLPEHLVADVFIPGRQGSLQLEMLAASRRHGALAVEVPRTLDALLRELAAGNPVVVLQNLSLPVSPVWHYAVAVGYDLGRREILLRSGPMRRQALALSTFELTWARGAHWGFVALAPGRLPAITDQSALTEALLAFERAAAPAAARLSYAAAAERWPDNPLYRIGLGNTAYAQGDLDGAAEAFRAAATIGGDGAAWHNLAVVLREQGRLAAAEDAALRAVQRPGPWQAQARDELARIRARRAAPATPPAGPAGPRR